MELRLVADYTDEVVKVEDAEKLVEQAKIFVATLQAEFLPTMKDSSQDLT